MFDPKNEAGEALMDIRSVHIDSSQPREARIRSFISQIGNPYRFKVGSVIVNVSYADCASTLNDRFTEMLSVMR